MQFPWKGKTAAGACGLNPVFTVKIRYPPYGNPSAAVFKALHRIEVASKIIPLLMFCLKPAPVKGPGITPCHLIPAGLISVAHPCTCGHIFPIQFKKVRTLKGPDSRFVLLQERTFKAPRSILPDIQQDRRHTVQAGSQYHIVHAFYPLYLGVPEIKGRSLRSFSNTRALLLHMDAVPANSLCLPFPGFLTVLLGTVVTGQIQMHLFSLHLGASRKGSSFVFFIPPQIRLRFQNIGHMGPVN